MKRLLSLLLALVMVLSLSTAAFADDDYIGRMEDTVSGWTDVEKLYNFGNQLFAVTKNGEVLTTNSDYSEVCSQFSNVESLCCGSTDSGYCDIVLGLCSDGGIDCAGPQSASELIDEILDWENVIELHSISTYDSGSGIFGICSDGSIRYTSNLENLFGSLSGEKIKALPYASSYSGAWVAITKAGKVLTNIEDFSSETGSWSGMENIWIVSNYNAALLLGRKSNGGTVVGPEAYESDEYGLKGSMEALNKCKSIHAVAYDYEDDWVVCLSDSGKAEIVYLGEWYEPGSDVYGVKPYLSKIKNAEAMYKFSYLQPENSDELLDAYGGYGPLLVFLCKDGKIADYVNSDWKISFKPEEANAKITSLVSIGEDEAIFGLTTKGTVTRIHVIGEALDADIEDEALEEDETSSGNYASTGSGSPSKADLDAIGTKIKYPASGSYLDEYIYSKITPSEGKTGVYAYASSTTSEKLRTIGRNEKVTVIAEENGRYCVIVESTNKAYWINTKYIPS